MTDKEMSKYHNMKYTNSKLQWEDYLKIVPTNELFQIYKISKAEGIEKTFSYIELGTRTDIPQEIKLELLLIEREII